MFCTLCGNLLPEEAHFCPYCGAKITNAAAEPDTAEPEDSLSTGTVGVSEIASQTDEEAATASDSPTQQHDEDEKTEESDAESEVQDLHSEDDNSASGTEPLTEQSGEAESKSDFEAVIENRNENSSEPQKRKWSKKKAVLFGAVALLFVLCAILIPVSVHNARVRRYNEGVTCLENGNYAEAHTIFTDLGSFDDAEKWADYAQMELDFQEIDRLHDSGNYEKIISILQARSKFYEDSEIGTEAAKLAAEYETVQKAAADMSAGDYSNAVDGFMTLDLLHEKFPDEICLCNAYIAEQEQNWSDILVNLYALQNGDPEKKFLENPVNDDDFLVLEASLSALDDPTVLLNIIEPDNAEAKALKSAAEKGFRYTEAKEEMDFGNYQAAMIIFEELGDFLDSEDCYEEAKSGYESYETTYRQAEAYYNNQEYFKAQELFLSIGDYKDAQEKSISCEQPLPENKAFRFGNGSDVDLSIKVPEGDESVFLKLYDADDNTVGQVFIRPGKSATVSMKGGTYTIKVAYGTEWYGEIDLFGTSGSYQQLLNESGTTFKLDSGYIYTLTLGGVSDGNVRTKDIDGASGM